MLSGNGSNEMDEDNNHNNNNYMPLYTSQRGTKRRLEYLENSYESALKKERGHTNSSFVHKHIEMTLNPRYWAIIEDPQSQQLVLNIGVGKNIYGTIQLRLFFKTVDELFNYVKIYNLTDLYWQTPGDNDHASEFTQLDELIANIIKPYVKSSRCIFKQLPQISTQGKWFIGDTRTGLFTINSEKEKYIGSWVELPSFIESSNLAFENWLQPMPAEASDCVIYDDSILYAVSKKEKMQKPMQRAKP